MTAPAPAPPRRPLPPLPPPPPPYLRPLLGFLAGLGVTVLVIAPGVIILTFASLRDADSAHFVIPPAFLVMASIIHLAGSMAGGLTTSRLTTGRSFYTVFLLATVLVTALVTQSAKGTPRPGEPTWYPLGLAFIVGVGSLAGGVLGRRRARHTGTDSDA
jgi:hypothetical protein